MASFARLLTLVPASMITILSGCATAPTGTMTSEVPPPIDSAHSAPGVAHPQFVGAHMSEASSSELRGNVMAVGLFGESRDGVESSMQVAADSNMKQVSFAIEGGDFTPDIDRQGRFVMYASKQHSQSFDLYRKSIDGRTVTQISTDPADDMMPALSPDGSKVAFVSNRAGNWDVFVMPSEGGPATQLTSEADEEVQPTWSPDGKRLAFARKNARTARWEIWSTDATQPTGATYLCDGFLPRWCPDAKTSKLLFQRARQQGSRLYGVWTVDLVNGEAMHPTEIMSAQNAAIIQPNWSPDGSRIVFTTVVDPASQSADLPEQCDLWIVNLDGTGRTSLTSSRFRNMQAVWGPDDRIYFVSNRGGIENLWAVSATKPSAPIEPFATKGAVAGAHESKHEEMTAPIGEMPMESLEPTHEAAPETGPNPVHETPGHG